jgi:hypothetical protein
MELMALSETLKLLFNIIHSHVDLCPNFTPSIPNVFKILVRRGVETPPLGSPTRELVNAMLHLNIEDAEGQKATFPSFDPKCNAEHLIKILDRAITSYPPRELDDTVTPVLTLVWRVYGVAPEGVQKVMEKMLLPTPEERDLPLGKSETLPSRLLNLSTSALTPTLRGSISELLFELSHKDPATFVHNVGYGYASGYLMSNNIAMPEELVQANTSKEIKGIPVNPITGQRLDREEQVQMEEMTQEEKEREAERLFVLFERYVVLIWKLVPRGRGNFADFECRLKATGVMNVQNPVEEAYRSGRIEELPDDSD